MNLFCWLTLSWRISLSYRNQSIDLLCKVICATGFYMIGTSVMKVLKVIKQCFRDVANSVQQCFCRKSVASISNSWWKRCFYDHIVTFIFLSWYSFLYVNNSQMFQNKSEKYIENNHDPIFLNFRFLLGFHLPLGMWKRFTVFITCISLKSPFTSQKMKSFGFGHINWRNR